MIQMTLIAVEKQPFHWSDVVPYLDGKKLYTTKTIEIALFDHFAT